MKVVKQIIAFILVFASLSSLFAVSAGADGLPVSLNVDVVDLVTMLQGSTHVIENHLLHLINEDVCPDNPSTNRLHNFSEQYTTVNGRNGRYYICEYCGKSGGEVLDPAYSNYVRGSCAQA